MASFQTSALIAVIFANLLLVFLLEYHFYQVRAIEHSRRDDTLGIWDVIPTQPVRMYIEDSVHYRLNGYPENAREWESLFPGDGMFSLAKGGYVQNYTTSMFHQLRCLNVLRVALVDMYKYNNSRGASDPTTQHCLNYWRQAVLCNADVHLDPMVGDKDSGAMLPREYICRDWVAAYHSLEKAQKLTVLY
ncbi:hypothetical protein Moror_9671 [Moniliophthora roreri MCA 2997]|uniref:Uncharacterized protein n=1 Tax=Moniliophthora roreri (strain MCA 2997) TaxID=1381753 RepID=V2WYN0_MONRO|nr:hypothetical protein Moror_9671 [Moniliophthora roreri MCA 2997]